MGNGEVTGALAQLVERFRDEAAAYERDGEEETRP
jgi:hypothetical protein